MTPEAQRIAIAEACGWVGIRMCLSLWNDDRREHYTAPLGFAPDDPFPHNQGEQEVPDYPNDLNAMHEAINSLTHDMRLEFLGWLDKVTVDPDDKKDQAWFPLRVLQSTVRQRAEAFLRTLGKWTDSD